MDFSPLIVDQCTCPLLVLQVSKLCLFNMHTMDDEQLCEV